MHNMVSLWILFNIIKHHLHVGFCPHSAAAEQTVKHKMAQ